MSGQRIGYIRVSSLEQNPERQLEGIEVNIKYIDTASGKDMLRPQLTAMLNYARDGEIPSLFTAWTGWPETYRIYENW